MANDTFIMSSRQAAELDHALERNGWTPADVKKLSSGDTLSRLLPVLRGIAEVTVRKHIVDLDVDPFVPEGWSVEDHQKGGSFEWDPTKVRFHLDEGQKDGKVIEGNKLRKQLKGQPVMNANLLDYLLANPHLIPEEWKGKYVFFWGTFYRARRGDLHVRYLYFDYGQWHWHCSWLDRGFDGSYPAAVRAS